MVRAVARTQDVLGEVPLWHPVEQALYWIDLFKPAVHRLDPATDTVRSWTPPMKLGSIALRTAGGLLLAGREGLLLTDADLAVTGSLGHPDADRPENILNDGRVDAAGRFFVGSMNRMLERASGRLFRVEADGRASVLADGIFIPNALAWSPDGRTLYFADSHEKTLYAYPFDPATGGIGERRVFADTRDEPGVPDGSAVDADGFLWNARFDGGAVLRYDPEGRLERRIELPVTRPTACTFGGPGLSTLFVTTARFRLPPERLAQEPEAGSLLAVETDVTGLSEPLFAG